MTVGTNPYGDAFDSANGNVYVANGGSGTVSVISGSNNDVIATVPEDGGPRGVAFDSANGDIYVVSEFANLTTVIPDSIDAVAWTVPVGGALTELLSTP